MLRYLLPILLLGVFLSACQPVNTPAAAELPAQPLEDAVIIEPEGLIQHVHDPVMAKDGDTYTIFHTGGRIPTICSVDMIRWEACGRVFERNPAWTRAVNPNLTDIWAPDISYFNDRWHLYYSVSTFGTQDSAIGLATNATLDPDHPDYAWVDQGEVLRSRPGDAWNAIDPNLVLDEDGEPWLVWGSFWRGIWMRKINKTTGMLDADQSEVYQLADRSTGPGSTTAVEAPFIIRRGSYWYLFVSFDQCCQGIHSTYNVRVGRSDALTGPYIDRDGKALTSGGGSPLISAYGPWMGPGHNGIFIEGDTYWIVYHAYDSRQIGVPKLRIESLAWDAAGWPLLRSQLSQP